MRFSLMFSPITGRAFLNQKCAEAYSEPAQFSRDDLDTRVTRDFCGNCGTHILARPPGFPGYVLKVGTMDDSSEFSPQMAIYTCDVQPYHAIAEGVMAFDKTPG